MALFRWHLKTMMQDIIWGCFGVSKVKCPVPATVRKEVDRRPLQKKTWDYEPAPICCFSAQNSTMTDQHLNRNPQMQQASAIQNNHSVIVLN